MIRYRNIDIRPSERLNQSDFKDDPEVLIGLPPLEMTTEFGKRYDRQVDIHDIKMTDDLGENLDVLLIFAALFSAINTAFISLTMPSLSADPLTETNALLRLLVAGAGNGTLPPADLTPPFTPSSNSVVVNSLLYASLSCSLLAAVGAMMAKQWLQSFDRTGQTGPLEEGERFRQRKFNGVQQWNLEPIIRSFPNILLLSVILFFAGVCLFLFPVNPVVAGVVVAFCGAGGILYAAAIVAGATSSLCPYQCASSRALEHMRSLLSPPRWKVVVTAVVDLAVRSPPIPSVVTGENGGATIIVQLPQPFLQQPTGVQPKTSGQTIIIQQPPQQVPLQAEPPQPILISQPVRPTTTGQSSIVTGTTVEPIVTTQPAQTIITVWPPPVFGQPGQPVVIAQPIQPPVTGQPLPPMFTGPIPSAVTGASVQTIYSGQLIQPGYTGQPIYPGITGQPLQPGPTGQPIQMVYPGQPIQPGLTGQPTLVTGPQPGEVVVLPAPVQPVGIQPIIGQPPLQTVFTGQPPLQPIVTGQPPFANVPQQVLVPGQVVQQSSQVIPGQVIQQPTEIFLGQVLQRPTQILQQPTHIVPPMMTGAPAQVIPPPPGTVVQPPLTVIQPPTETIQPVRVVPGPQLVPYPTIVPRTQTPGVILTHPSGATGQSVILGPGGQQYPAIVLAPQTGAQPLGTGQGPIYVAQPQPFVTGQPPVVVAQPGGQPLVVGEHPGQPVVIGPQPTIPMVGVPRQPIAVQQPRQPFIVTAPQPGQPLVVPTGQPIMIPIQPGQTGQPPIMIQQPGGGAPIALHPGQQYIIGQPGMPYVQQLQPGQTEMQPIYTGVQPIYTGVQPIHTGVQPIYTGVQPIHTGLQPHPTGVEVPITGTPYVTTPFVPQVTGVTGIETHYTGAPTVLPHMTGGVQTVLSPPPGRIQRVHTGVGQSGYPSGVQSVYPSGVESTYPSGVQFVGRPGHEQVSSERPHRPESTPLQTVIQLPPQPMPHVIGITSPHRANPHPPTPQPITIVQEPPPREASPPVRIIERVGPTPVHVVEPLQESASDLVTEPASELGEPPLEIEVVTPVDGGPSHLSVVEEEPPSIHDESVSSVPEDEVPVVEPPSPPRTAPPTIIRLPDSGPSRAELPPAVVRVGTSFGARPASPTFVQLPPSKPATPAIVRIQGAPITAPPPIDQPPQVELVTPTGTARHPLTVISYESGPTLVEEPLSPERPPQTEISAPSATYMIPPRALHSPPPSVMTPVPHRVSMADLDRLQEQVHLQDEC